MAINETISKGNKYRRLKDAANKVWQRISFWTAASDVEFENGNTLQSTLGTVTGITDSLTSNSSTVAASAAAVYSLNSKITSFSGSLSDLYNAFVAKGVTPTAKTLAACVAAVNTLYTKAQSAGYTSGYSAGHKSVSFVTTSNANDSDGWSYANTEIIVPSGYTKLTITSVSLSGSYACRINNSSGANIHSISSASDRSTISVSSGSSYTIVLQVTGGYCSVSTTLS